MKKSLFTRKYGERPYMPYEDDFYTRGQYEDALWEYEYQIEKYFSERDEIDRKANSIDEDNLLLSKAQRDHIDKSLESNPSTYDPDSIIETHKVENGLIIEKVIRDRVVQEIIAHHEILAA